MEEMDADPSLPASAIATSPVHLAAPPPLSASRSYHQEPPGLCHSSSRTFAPRSCLFPPDPGTPCSLSLTPAFPRASDMCTGKCARCLGLSLIPLSLICIVANALLLVPDGKTTWTGSNLSLQVWLMGGFIGGGLMVLCPGIAAVRAGGKGCCGAGCCGNRCRMLRSVFSSAFGMLGALYCLAVAGAGLRVGPKCLVGNKWDYHLQDTQGAYLRNHTLWSLCEAPPHVVPWNVTLFSILVAASSLETVLCGVQLVNAACGVLCGDCRKKEGSAH